MRKFSEPNYNLQPHLLASPCFSPSQAPKKKEKKNNSPKQSKSTIPKWIKLVNLFPSSSFWMVHYISCAFLSSVRTRTPTRPDESNIRPALRRESFLCLAFLPAMSSQHPEHSDPTQESYTSPPITVIITVILLVFFFVGFFSIYFCKCFMQNLLFSWHLRQSPAGTPVVPTAPQNAPGIDPKIIQSFPTFAYSSVKGYRKEKCGLECAICLVEFGDEDVLRLLTSCCHVFHQECIDLWLERHTTCPVCRRSLDAAEDSPEKSPISFTRTMRLINGQEQDRRSPQDSVSITIKEEGEGGERGGDGGGERLAASAAGDDEEQENKFPRSHSTGHSIVRSRDDEDRFTLRLPEQVRAKTIKGHSSSKSCTTFGV